MSTLEFVLHSQTCVKFHVNQCYLFIAFHKVMFKSCFTYNFKIYIKILIFINEIVIDLKA